MHDESSNSDSDEEKSECSSGQSNDNDNNDKIFDKMFSAGNICEIDDNYRPIRSVNQTIQDEEGESLLS